MIFIHAVVFTIVLLAFVQSVNGLIVSSTQSTSMGKKVLAFSHFFNRYGQSNKLFPLNAAEKQIIGKKKLIDLLADQTGERKSLIEGIIECFLFQVESNVIEKGNEIRLQGFGTFKRRVNSPKTGRNPKTGEAIQIVGSTTLAFSPSQALKVKDDQEE